MKSSADRTPLSARRRPLRILHCTWNIAGQSAQLAASEREMGADSINIVLEESGSGFFADEHLIEPGAGRLVREMARWKLTWKAIMWADVVHFSFGQSCLVPHAYPGLDDVDWRDPAAVIRRLYARAVWMKDVPILVALGKKIAVTWQGDDARQQDRSKALFEHSIADEVDDKYYPPGSDDWKRRAIDVFDKHAHCLYSLNPDIMHYLPSRTCFLPYASIDPFSIVPTYPVPGPQPVRFAHAPSHRSAKGTRHILAAAERLRSEGYDFELEIVEGLTRQEAIARYTHCDVVIDQLLAGWYGGLGVEAMSLGKPVVAYIREGDLKFVDQNMRNDLPIIRADPGNIYSVMKIICEMQRSEIIIAGKRSRLFAEKYHDPISLANITLNHYTNS